MDFNIFPTFVSAGPLKSPRKCDKACSTEIEAPGPTFYSLMGPLCFLSELGTARLPKPWLFYSLYYLIIILILLVTSV